MTLPKAAKNRLEIRQAIGYNMGVIIVGEATSTVDDDSLIDTLYLALGGDDEYNARQVQINATPTGSIVAGEQSFVSDFDNTPAGTCDATCAPAFTDVITDGDTYEMWKQGFLIGEVNEKINQAIIAATDDILVDKVDTTLYKLKDIYEHTIPTGFVGIHTVEYEYSRGVDHLLEDCEDAWTAGDSVAATADTFFTKVGTNSAKFVVGDAAASGATLCYEDISSIDISDCDKIEFHMYSSIALTAGQLQFMLGATAAIASPLETINIPAMTAATGYKHCISLANPHSDTAIISIGIRQASTVDVGACTLYIDEVRAIKDGSRVYRQLNPDMWGVVQGTTNKLQLSEAGYSVIGDNYILRLSGYAIPAELSDESTDCTIDPDYVIAKATALMMMSHAGGRDVDPDDYQRRADRWMAIAERRLVQSRTPLENNTRWVA